MDSHEALSAFDRREFLKLAVAAAAGAAAGGAVTEVAEAQSAPATPAPAVQQQQDALPPLGNGEPPAMQFQAYPGGTGAYMEKIAKERGRAAFERKEHKIDGWKGPVPTSDEEIAFLPVHRLSALIKSKKISPVRLTQIYLDRLKRYNDTLLCAVTILDDSAMAAARQAEQEINSGHYRGPLHGIPWGVKDLFAVKGAPTTWGAEDFQNQVIDADAEVVVRLRDAGAILIAKLATGRFANGDQWFRGQTKNPWNTDEGSSGSSAGPASATAAGCVAFGIGTETQGSIVSPATRCGLSALRPTFGRVSRYGAMTLSWSQDKVGPFGRTIEDCALVFNTIYGADEKDPATVTAPFRFDPKVDLSKLRIGYDDRAPQEFVDKLKELGAKPVAVGDRPSLGNGRAFSGGGGFTVEAAAAFDFYISARPADVVVSDSTELAAQAAAQAARRAAFEAARAAGGGGGGGGGGGRGAGRGGAGGPPPPLVAGGRGMMISGRDVTALDYIQSQRRRLMLMNEMAEFMKDLDLYVSGRGDIVLTNQTGHPCVVVPYAMTDDDHPQPRTVTLIGGLFNDDLLLSVAHKYQMATEWHKQHPKLG